ncbi:TetR/AcrR family transcriptional regulator [Nonomuraea salmonea]|uniref:TetR/AcrR family transcriptional regulator n=1 Tax=Nonomuraea salmonea TaxID=46181 RepID=UPI002FE9D73B
MDTVWSRRRTEPKPRLTLDRIVAEALALLDEEGVARLTMRRLAERLGTGSTTLYWHVKTKDDVLDLAMDAVFGEVGLPDGGAGGRTGGRGCAR